MIRPAALLQSNQALDSDFSAPVRLQAKHLHCGLGMNGYYWEPDCIQRFATHRVFVGVLALLGFIQGAAMGYFASTASEVAQNFGFSQTVISKFYSTLPEKKMQRTHGLCTLALGYNMCIPRSCRVSDSFVTVFGDQIALIRPVFELSVLTLQE